MISQQKLTAFIKNEIAHDIEDRPFEELQAYTPDECTIFEGVCEALESDGASIEYLESDKLYNKFQALFAELKESDWYYNLEQDHLFHAKEAKDEAERPYASRGLTRGDFYA